jgi:hypothetical protein
VSCQKTLIPLSQENIEVVGVLPAPLPHLIEALIQEHLRQYLSRIT